MQPGVGVVAEIIEVLVERDTTAGTVAAVRLSNLLQHCE
jgi:hypothetical protein